MGNFIFSSTFRCLFVFLIDSPIYIFADAIGSISCLHGQSRLRCTRSRNGSTYIQRTRRIACARLRKQSRCRSPYSRRPKLKSKGRDSLNENVLILLLLIAFHFWFLRSGYTLLGSVYSSLASRPFNRCVNPHCIVHNKLRQKQICLFSTAPIL